MNMTSSAALSEKSPSATSLPRVSASLKSGATVPSFNIVDGVLAMEKLFAVGVRFVERVFPFQLPFELLRHVENVSDNPLAKTTICLDFIDRKAAVNNSRIKVNMLSS